MYYEDTDTGGIVFYANYLKFFERARTEWLRSGGIDQSALTLETGVIFVVMRTAVEYHSAAKLDNELKLSVAVEKLGRASVEFLQHAWRLGNTQAVGAGGGADSGCHFDTREVLVATGRIKVACVDRNSLRPQAIPPQVLHFIQRSMQPDGSFPCGSPL